MTPAEEQFEEIRTGGYDRLVQFKADHQAEDLYLDFVRKRDPSNGTPEQDDRKNYSTALSGFANLGGGVIVWGIQAARDAAGQDVASALIPIQGHRAFSAALNGLASQLVTRAVDGVRNEPIDDPSNSKQGCVISLIPESDLAPHRAEAHGLKAYFKRNGSSFVRMEHVELEDMFGRRRRAKWRHPAGFDPAASTDR